MIIIKVIVGVVGYIIISIITTILFIYADRKAGEPAQKVYEEHNFYEYCILGFLFPIHIPCIVAERICKFIKKFIKIMCIAIVEKKMITEENKDNNDRK